MHMHSTKKYPVQIVCDGDAESPQKICWAGHVPPRKCYEQEIRCGPEPDVMPALENTGGTWRSALNVLQSPFFWPKCEHFIGEYDGYIYIYIYICGYSCPRFKIVEVPGTGIPVPRIWGQIKTSGFGDLPGLEVPFHAHYSRVDQITNTRTQSVHIASWLGVANIYELRVFITMILFLTLQSIISVLSSFHVFALICVTLL